MGDLRHWDFATPADCANDMALDGIVFETALRNGVERITFASSACVYPAPLQQQEQIPLTEDMVSFERRTGWEPRRSFERGVEATVAWFLERRDIASLKDELEDRLLAR